MSAPHPGGERELALGLAAAIERALAPGASSRAMRAARDAAAILGFDGLDRVLGEVAARGEGAWPPEVEPVRDRLLRVAAQSRHDESLGAFRAGDWDGLAGELAALEWTGRRGHEVATIALAVALGDLRYEGSGRVDECRLSSAVAASLRAALDWITGDVGRPPRLRVRVEESALEIGCHPVEAAGLDVAARILAGVDGSLGPTTRSGESGWMLRVPAVAAHDHYLMVEHGPLRLAIPWHAVLRIQTIPAAALAERAAEAGVPALAPLAPLAGAAAERPVVTVGHGPRRGWFPVDRVIWRFAADPAPAGAIAPAGLNRVVRTEEGEDFAVATAARLLADAPLPESWTAAAGAARQAALLRVVPAGPGDAPLTAAEVVPLAPAADVAAAEPAAPTEPGATADARPRFDPASERDPGTEFAPAGGPVTEPDPAPAPEPGRDRGAGSESPSAANRASSGGEPEPPAAGPATPLPSQLPAAGAPAAPATRNAELPPAFREPAPAAPVPAGSPATRIADPAPVELTAADVTPLGAAAVAPRVPDPPLVASAPLSALLVEDGFAARAFLAQTLADRGFEVAVASRVRELDEALEQRPWSLVLLDVAVSEAPAARFLRAVVERLRRRGAKTPVVALVRDRHDVAVAALGGLDEWLEKPVDERALVRLIERLGAARRLA